MLRCVLFDQITDQARIGQQPLSERHSAQELVTIDEVAAALRDEGELVVLGRRSAVLTHESKVDRGLRGGGVRLSLVYLDSADSPPEAVVARAATGGLLHCRRQLTPSTTGVLGDFGVVRLHEVLKPFLGVRGGRSRDNGWRGAGGSRLFRDLRRAGRVGLGRRGLR